MTPAFATTPIAGAPFGAEVAADLRTPLDQTGQEALKALFIREKLQQVFMETGTTMLLVSHDLNPLAHAMDRVLYLADGRAASGTVDEVVNEDTLSRLYDRPVDVLRVRGRIIVVAGD